MDEAVRDILDALRRKGALGPAELDRIIRRHSKRAHDGRRSFAKKRILPHYLARKAEGGPIWDSWQVDGDLDAAFRKTLKMKPRRTASGVATITVLTKPWPCSGNCIFCPNDVRMPKSYLHDEPACQRAERNCFDPYLQLASRLRTLQQMGHPTEKIELIVLGGTWTDYPRDYRIWFVEQLFEALNADEEARRDEEAARRGLYASWGIAHDADTLAEKAAALQNGATSAKTGFNEAWDALYGADAGWVAASAFQSAGFDELEAQHARNEVAEHRVVGLVVETRPDALSCAALAELRKLGCTKVQVGVQGIDDKILALNGRGTTRAQIAEAINLARLFGFKTHAHFMLNLLGSTPEADIAAFSEFAKAPEFSPDEVKLYPCALVAGTVLAERFEEGSWAPYTEEELVRALSAAMAAVPPFMRISRMIRDISAKDILAGNKKTNLRQMVEATLPRDDGSIREIRFREISTDDVDVGALQLEVYPYETEATEERFLQWVTPEGRIAGFLRLSLPRPEAISAYGDRLPIGAGEAMIREVHVYGVAAQIHGREAAAQHQGLGRRLVEAACDIARTAGYAKLNVISAVGTREYYRRLGFADADLYQQRAL